MKVPEWKPYPEIKLCCQVKPLYRCRRCTYQKCSDHTPAAIYAGSGTLLEKEEYLHPFYMCCHASPTREKLCIRTYCGRCVTWWVALEAGRQSLHSLHEKYQS